MEGQMEAGGDGWREENKSEKDTLAGGELRARESDRVPRARVCSPRNQRWQVTS